MGLLEAKNFVEGVPSILGDDVDQETADKMKQNIEAAGGTIEVK